MPRDGWASRQIANTEQNIREWPKWMQRYLEPVGPPDELDEAFWGKMCARLMTRLEETLSREEWLCEKCNLVHAPQPGGITYHPCPDCGATMLPTSPELREITRLKKELAESRRMHSEMCREVERLTSRTFGALYYSQSACPMCHGQPTTQPCARCKGYGFLFPQEGA